MSILDRAAPALQSVWDANYVRMVGFKTLHIVDQSLGCTRPDLLTNESDLPLEVTVLITGERVNFCGIGEHVVEFDPFSDDPHQTIKFVPV